MADENDNLPATQEAGLPPLDLNGLPARQLAAETITDVLPAVVYQNIGGLSNTLSPEQEEILDEPTPEDEIEIRPDGLVYAGHELYRRKLNKVFGRFGWTLIPGSPLKNRLDKSQSDRSEWYQRWVLFVNGIYVSEAIASRTLYEDNRQMSLDDVAEAIKSDALKRACKDLGIAHELWQKRWTEKWRREHAVQVPCRVWKRGSQVVENRWRRKDQDALEGELTADQKDRKSTTDSSPVSGTGSIRTSPDAPKPAVNTGMNAQRDTAQSGSQQTGRASNAEVGNVSNSTTSTQQPRPTQARTASGTHERISGTRNSQSASRYVDPATAQSPSQKTASGTENLSSTEPPEDTAKAANAGPVRTQSPSTQGSGESARSNQNQSLNSTERSGAMNRDAAATDVRQPAEQRLANTGRGPFISMGQRNLLLARARNAGLLVGDDPALLLDLLYRENIEPIETPGKTSMENCVATIATIPMKALNVVLKAIDSQKSEEVERI